MLRSIAALLALLLTGTLVAPAAARAQAIGSQRIRGAAFEKLAKSALAHVAVPGDSELVPAFSVQDQVVDAGSVSLVLDSPMISPSYVNVPIQIDVNGTYVRTLYVGYRVVQFERTAVAAHDLVAGTVLEPGDVKMARVPSNGRVPNGTNVLLGRKIFSAFRKGQPIAIEETQVNQIVKPGSSVVLIVNDGDVSVVAQAVARSGGGLGDQVNVYNPATNKTLSGTVIGPDRVQLDILGGN